MSLLDRLLGRQPEPQRLIVEVQSKLFSVKEATRGRFRRGMWVMLGNKIGILEDATPEGMGKVMLTHPVEGTNQLQVLVRLAELRQAKWQEIPAKRREHLSSADLNRMGYED